MKIFVVGFPKSGTSTLQKAFEESGLRSAHWQVPAGYVGQLIYADHMEGKDPLSSLSGYDCVTQADVCLPSHGINYWPNLDFAVLERIAGFHPETTFLLNYRSPEKIAKSMCKWNELAARMDRCDIPGLPKGYGRSEKHLVIWIENHINACRRFFQGAKFAEIDIEDPLAREMVGRIVGTPLKWWGVANANPVRALIAPVASKSG